MSGPAAGLTKWFYYPGFTALTGGLLREPDLLQRQENFDRQAWRSAFAPMLNRNDWLVSLFSYEPPALPQLLEQLSFGNHKLLVTPGRSQLAVSNTLPLMRQSLEMINLYPTDQFHFDEMLWGSDLNFVRGEDSLVRALWAGQPFVWQIYPQFDNAHHAKLEAFLDWLQAPHSLRQFHRIWNGLEPGRLDIGNHKTLADWQACVLQARKRLLSQTDLISQLLSFIASRP